MSGARMTAIEAMCVSVNVSLAEAISPAELERMLRSGALDPRWKPHVEILFSEIAPSLWRRLLDETGMPIEPVRELYAAVPFAHNAVTTAMLYRGIS